VLVFQADSGNERVKCINVTINPDDRVEDNEIFILRLVNINLTVSILNPDAQVLLVDATGKIVFSLRMNKREACQKQMTAQQALTA